MRRRKMALRRRIRMLIVALILVVVGILIVPISRLELQPVRRTILGLNTEHMLFNAVIHCGVWQTVIWERILIIIRITSKR